MKCSQEGCDVDAKGTFIWPSDMQDAGGHPACDKHLQWAITLAKHMGFYLPVGGADRVLELEKKAAAEAIAILSGERDPVTGKVMEVIVMSKPITMKQRRDVEDYLKKKHGI